MIKSKMSDRPVCPILLPLKVHSFIHSFIPHGVVGRMFLSVDTEKFDVFMVTDWMWFMVTCLKARSRVQDKNKTRLNDPSR